MMVKKMWLLYKYILRTILAVYIDFEERVDYVDEKPSSIELLEESSQ